MRGEKSGVDVPIVHTTQAKGRRHLQLPEGNQAQLGYYALHRRTPALNNSIQDFNLSFRRISVPLASRTLGS